MLKHCAAIHDMKQYLGTRFGMWATSLEKNGCLEEVGAWRREKTDNDKEAWKFYLSLFLI